MYSTGSVTGRSYRKPVRRRESVGFSTTRESFVKISLFQLMGKGPYTQHQTQVGNSTKPPERERRDPDLEHRRQNVS
jgi:hypothetical protein